MKTQWPIISGNPSQNDVANFIREVTRLRQIEDLPDFTSLNQVFVSGRSTLRVPTSALDVESTDVLGDICYATDGSYVYILVDVSGTNKWARIALDTAW